jgi:hypothetical protein
MASGAPCPSFPCSRARSPVAASTWTRRGERSGPRSSSSPNALEVLGAGNGNGNIRAATCAPRPGNTGLVDMHATWRRMRRGSMLSGSMRAWRSPPGAARSAPWSICAITAWTPTATTPRALASILTTWVRRQMLSDDNRRAASEHPVQDPAVCDAVSVHVVNELYDNVNGVVTLDLSAGEGARRRPRHLAAESTLDRVPSDTGAWEPCSLPRCSPPSCSRCAARPCAHSRRERFRAPYGAGPPRRARRRPTKPNGDTRSPGDRDQPTRTAGAITDAEYDRARNSPCTLHTPDRSNRDRR